MLPSGVAPAAPGRLLCKLLPETAILLKGPARRKSPRTRTRYRGERSVIGTAQAQPSRRSAEAALRKHFGREAPEARPPIRWLSRSAVKALPNRIPAMGRLDLCRKREIEKNSGRESPSAHHPPTTDTAATFRAWKENPTSQHSSSKFRAAGHHRSGNSVVRRLAGASDSLRGREAPSCSLTRQPSCRPALNAVQLWRVQTAAAAMTIRPLSRLRWWRLSLRTARGGGGSGQAERSPPARSSSNASRSAFLWPTATCGGGAAAASRTSAARERSAQAAAAFGFARLALAASAGRQSTATATA